MASYNFNPSPAPSAPPLYLTLTMADLASVEIPSSPTTPDGIGAPPPSEDVFLRIPGTQLHLIDRHRSHLLAAGDLSMLRIHFRDTSLAAIVFLDPIQWSLARDVATVKLDPYHYTFSLTVPVSPDDPSPDPLHYGLTLANLDPLLDDLLGMYTSFSVHSVVCSEALTDRVRGEVEAAAYWTVVAPNVEEYGSAVAKGILWCGGDDGGEVPAGNEVLGKRIQPADWDAEVSPEMLRRIKREDLRSGRSGREGCAIHVIDGDDRSGISQYGEKVAAATNKGLDTAGHAIGTAWVVFKIRQAMYPKSILKPTSLTKSTIKAAATDLRAKHSKSSK